MCLIVLAAGCLAACNTSTGWPGSAANDRPASPSTIDYPVAPGPPTRPPPPPSGDEQSLRDVVLGAESGVLLYGYDALTYPRVETQLAVRLLRAADLEPIADVTITFFQKDQKVGMAYTDGDGLATIHVLPTDEGDYVFTARITNAPGHLSASLLDVSPASLLVAARGPETRCVVVDLDYTVAKSSLAEAIFRDTAPVTDAKAVLRRIAKHYDLIYLAHSSQEISSAGKGWLARHKLPEGPMLMADSREPADSRRRGSPKLTDIRQAFPRTAFGISSDLADADSFVDSGLKGFLLAPAARTPGAMREQADAVRHLPADKGLNVVRNWREIESGVLLGMTFPPEAFARRLDRLAGELDSRRR
jgi:hypothetical protein